jgi:hypothetical protein
VRRGHVLGAQEPARRGGHPGPGIVVGRLLASRLLASRLLASRLLASRLLASQLLASQLLVTRATILVSLDGLLGGIRLRRARIRTDQALRNGPRPHETCGFVLAGYAFRLRFFH